jgi:hypothetical protein
MSAISIFDPNRNDSQIFLAIRLCLATTRNLYHRWYSKGRVNHNEWE